MYEVFNVGETMPFVVESCVLESSRAPTFQRLTLSRIEDRSTSIETEPKAIQAQQHANCYPEQPNWLPIEDNLN